MRMTVECNENNIVMSHEVFLPHIRERIYSYLRLGKSQPLMDEPKQKRHVLSKRLTRF